MTRWLERPEGRLAYEVRGEGPLVVCAHGMGDQRGQFRALAPALVDAGYRVALLDLRGHGESDATFTDHGPVAVGSDLLALLEAEGGRGVIVANSAAAASAIWAAAEAPDRVAGLALLGPVARDGAHDRPMPAAVQRLLGWILSGPWGPALWLRFYDSLYKGGLPPDHAAHRARIRASLSDRRRLRALWDTGTLPKGACAARIGEVRAPSLVVMGSRDPDFADAPAEGAWLAEALGGRCEILEGVGHYPHLEQPEATARRVLALLEQACAARA